MLDIVSGFPNVSKYPPIDIDIVGYLETILNSPEPTTTSSKLSYADEITLLETALSVLTHTRILPGSITLDPSQNDKVIYTGFQDK
jgi:hypothetical protein